MKQSMSLTTDPISQLTWRIALPISVGMFFNTMFNVVDTLCAGWLGTDALAALSLSFPVFFIIIAVGSGLSQGTTALMANALGAGDAPEARRVFAQSLIFAVIGGVALSIVGWFAAPSLFRLLGAEGDYLRTVLTFMNVTLAGGVFYLLPMVMNSALSAQGDTRAYRNFLIAGFAANIALNPVLMWGLLGLPAMGVGGILASASFDGATDTELFVTFIGEALAPMLKAGQVVVLDNLPAHKSPRVDQLVESVGARVLRLPPYSPDYNPIEMAISKVKTVLRKLAHRSVDGLFTGIGEALQSIRATDALNYIGHCGYATKRRKTL